MDLEERIIEALRGKRRSFSELVKVLGLFKKKEKKLLKKTLRRLKREGKLLVENGRYSLRERVVEGYVRANPAGFGFLETQEGRQIYIPFFEMRKLMEGDYIRAKVVEFKGKEEIRVLRILKRAKKSVVGKVKRDKKGFYLEPLDENKHLTFILEGENLKEKEVVVAKILRYPSKSKRPKARVVETLGKPSEKYLMVEILIRKYELPLEFPKEVLKEVDKIREEIPQEEFERRKDLREQVCFTIDPERAKDFDDAVAIKREGDGYRLFVHIADVSYYVKENTNLDKEARRRGFTFYLPDRAIPMLPEKLSSYLCSLMEGEERLTFTVEVKVSEDGEILYYDIYESIIKSKARLTYDQALEILKEGRGEIGRSLRLMENLYRILHKKRWEEGSIDFDLPESEVIVDEFGEPKAVLPYQRHLVHRLIEQFMILANFVVASHLTNTSYPCLYRIHEEPDPERVERLLRILQSLGYRVKAKDYQNPKFFQKILEDFEGREEENLVKFLTLRSMMRAKYSPHNLGHFGLALPTYTHFTSPIRRYADLTVHRLLKKQLMGKEINYEKTVRKLEELGKHLSRREELADEVEREAIEKMKLRLLKDKVGETFEGIITGVFQFGFFVELKEVLVEGLVSLRELKDDQYIFDEENQRLVGVKSGKSYRLGDRVRVRILAVREEEGEMDLTVEG